MLKHHRHLKYPSNQHILPKKFYLSTTQSTAIS